MSPNAFVSGEGTESAEQKCYVEFVFLSRYFFLTVAGNS